MFSISLQAQELGSLFVSEKTMEFDKQNHALASMAIGAVSYIYFDTKPNNTEMDAYLKSAFTVGTIGLLKEANDKWLGGREFSFDDLSANMFGWFIGATTAYLLRRRSKRVMSREQKDLKRLKAIYNE